MTVPTTWTYEALSRLVVDVPLPCVVVDLDAFDRNTRRLCDVAQGAGMTLRIASKSVRVPALLHRAMETGGDTTRGLMCFGPREAAFLADEGFDNLLVAYPTLQDADLEALWQLRGRAVDVSLMLDSDVHVRHLDAWWSARAGGETAPPLQVCVDLDMSYRPLGGLGPHLGVQRSSVRGPNGFRALLRHIRDAGSLSLRGVMGYEAQIAGLGEANPFTPLLNPVKRAIKARSTRDVARQREAYHRILSEEGFTGYLFNGGGTGSIRTTTREPWITEVTAGSGLLQSHLFDYYADSENEPALFFALQVTRRPEPGLVTCQSGGFVASGEVSPDKAPVVFLPDGLEPLGTESFGEVQTPLKVPRGVTLSPGDPVFCRPAKAGEIAERFDEYLLVSGGRVVDRAKTYRGLGRCFY